MHRGDLGHVERIEVPCVSHGDESLMLGFRIENLGSVCRRLGLVFNIGVPYRIDEVGVLETHPQSMGYRCERLILEFRMWVTEVSFNVGILYTIGDVECRK